MHQIKQSSKVYRSSFNQSGEFNTGEIRRVDQDTNISMDTNIDRWRNASTPHYNDEIPPFDISITFLNEYGQASQMSIYGVELTNEGMGLSIDDITTEKACTFVARGISDMGAYDHQEVPHSTL